MGKIQEAVALITKIANDNSHGYDQANRWGPDFDCSSLIIYVWQSVGVPVRGCGATYTGNMRGPFLTCGFTDVTNRVNLYTGVGIEAGDVLINYTHHTVMSIGNGRIASASLNENGGTSGGRTGDQTGQEIKISGYYLPSYGWDCVLRYTKDTAEKPTTPPTVVTPSSPEKPTTPADEQNGITYCTPTPRMPEIPYGANDKKGYGGYVRLMQERLMRTTDAEGNHPYNCGWYGADGDYGQLTKNALVKFQKDHGLLADGVCGKLTWAALLGVKE